MVTSAEIKAMTREELVAARIEAEDKQAVAKREESKATYKRQDADGRIRFIQRHCPHANVVQTDTPWQGGGLYFTRSHCLDCNRKGSRYDRALTIQKNREWDAMWAHDKKDKGDEYYEDKTPHVAHVSLSGDENW